MAFFIYLLGWVQEESGRIYNLYDQSSNNTKRTCMVGGLSWTNIKTVSTNERQANVTLTNHRPENCFHSFQNLGNIGMGKPKTCIKFCTLCTSGCKNKHISRTINKICNETNKLCTWRYRIRVCYGILRSDFKKIFR